VRIAIVEDEAVYQRQLREYLNKYQDEFHCALQISVFDSGISFIHSFSSQFDIILLDVAMPYIDGIETARRIREMDTEVVILFVTNQAQHAIRGYEVDALDYILKPISYFAFSQRLKRALSRVSRKEEPCLVLNLK
jgi:DNA-binding LytR/AlgR family response regulator